MADLFSKRGEDRRYAILQLLQPVFLVVLLFGEATELVDFITSWVAFAARQGGTQYRFIAFW